MQNITEQEDRITIEQKAGTGERLFLTALGLFPLIAPYELLIKPRWHLEGLLTPMGMAIAAIPVIISIAALGISYTLLWSALIGPNMTLTADRRYNRFSCKQIAPFRKKIDFIDRPLHELEGLSIREKDWDDGPATYAVEVLIPGHRHTIQIASFKTREEAERILEKLKPAA